MADRELNIVIRAKDEASQVFQSLAGMGRNVLAVGFGVATAAVSGLSAGLALCVKAAGDEQVGIQQLGAAVTASGGDWDTARVAIESYLRAEGDRVALDDGVGREALSRLTTATGDYEEAMRLLPIAIDLAAAKNIDLATASELVGKVSQGNLGTLSRYGIVLKEGATPMEALLELQKRFAGQGEAFANTFQGQQQRLSVAIGNLKETIGAALLPVVSAIAERFANWAIDVLPKVEAAIDGLRPVLSTIYEYFRSIIREGEPMDEYLSGLPVVIQPIVKWFADLSSTIFWEVIPALRELITPIVAFVTQHAESFKAAIAAIIGLLVGAAFLDAVGGAVGAIAALANPVNAVIAAVALLALAWTNDWGGMRTTILAWWEESGKAIFEALQVWLGENIPKAITTLTQFWTDTLQPAMATVWTWVWESLIPTLGDLATWLSENIPVAIAAVAEFWRTTLWPAMQDVWAWLQDPLLPTLGEIVAWFGTNIPVAMQALVDFWQDILAPALTAIWAYIQDPLIPIIGEIVAWLGTNVPIAMQALVNFWNGTLKPALQAIRDFIADPLIPIIQSVVTWLGTNVPVAMQALVDFWNGTLQPALAAIWAYINDPLIPIVKDVVTWFGTNIPKAMQALVDFWNDPLKGILSDIWAYINDPLLLILEDLAAIGFDAVVIAARGLTTFWNDYLKGMFEAVLKAAGDLADKLSGPLNEAWTGIKDAAGLFWDVISKVSGWAGTGLALFFDGMNLAIQAVKAVLDGIRSAIEWIIGHPVTGQPTSNNPTTSNPSDIPPGPYGQCPSGYLLYTVNGVNVCRPVSAFASGTVYATGGLALVGEQGPELVTMPRGARVYNAAETAAMGAGASTTWNVTINSAQPGVRVIDDIRYLQALAASA